MISTIEPQFNGSGSSSSGVSVSVNQGNSESVSSSRRPSYVGLSKSVSGYSTLYPLSGAQSTEEGAFRRSIPVAKDPQTLDAMRSDISPKDKMLVSPKSSLKTTTYSLEISSQESYSTVSSTNSATCGNLVQKQIERLYGGKLQPAVLRSPPRSSSSLEQSPLPSPTLGQQQLKVPAVFRLLRPEFREQLKMHSCTVDIPEEGSHKTKKERLIPIEKVVNGKPKERLIPILREESPPSVVPVKPALPAKPPSPVKTLKVPSETKEEVVLEKEKDVEMVVLVAKDEVDDYLPLASEDESGLVGGLRERELLCTIVEEDNESTASGYSLHTRSNGQKLNVVKPPQEDEAMDLLPKKDGNYFIKLIENEVFKFEEQVCDFEEDLCNNDALMNEDVRECILAAIGKAKLLMGQKLAQFRGLCDRNINSTVESDPFVPTSDDLAGFWDMVYIQVEHIHSLFAELVAIRQNGWKKPETKPPTTQNGNSSKHRSESRPVKKKKKASPASKPKSEAAKARDEARRKMLEERKRELMRQKTEMSSHIGNGENGSVLMII